MSDVSSASLDGCVSEDDLAQKYSTLMQVAERTFGLDHVLGLQVTDTLIEEASHDLNSSLCQSAIETMRAETTSSLASTIMIPSAPSAIGNDSDDDSVDSWPKDIMPAIDLAHGSPQSGLLQSGLTPIDSQSAASHANTVTETQPTTPITMPILILAPSSSVKAFRDDEETRV